MNEDVSPEDQPSLSKTEGWILYIVTALFVIYVAQHIARDIAIARSLSKEWDAAKEEMALGGYKKIATYGSPRSNARIGNRVYPDAYVCKDPKSLVFIDRKGDEVSFIDSDMAWCQ